MWWLITAGCIMTLPVLETQRTETVRMPGNDDTCNVVNVNFGGGHAAGGEDDSRIAGAPGKQGAAGPKGSKGNQGHKGERGESIDEGKVMRDILEMMNTRTCQELSQTYGVTETGYYLMRGNSLSTSSPVYTYCDFKIYEGISNCDELVARNEDAKRGYYRLRDRSGSVSFHYCPTAFTCHQLLQQDSGRESGLYHLGPAGNTYEVYCNFFSGEAVTEVWHDSMNEIKVSPACEPNGCYSHAPRYKLDLTTIVKIIENSRECRQYIKVRCVGVVLLYNNRPRGWWVSREGEKMHYWGGAISKRPGYCACGETGSCLDKGYKCNCDNNDGAITEQDDGYLTDKSKLPVREMKFGDHGANGENAWHTLGALECTGQA